MRTFDGMRTANDRLAVWMPCGLAMLAAATSLITLAGYAFGVVDLIRLRSDWQTMSMSTALLCVGLAVALAGDALRRFRVTTVAGALTLALSATVLAGDLATGHDTVSPVLVAMFGGVSLGGETSGATALCAGLLAIASLRRPRVQPAAMLAITVMLISGLAVLGYAYGVKDLYALSPFRTMSLRTAVSLFLLASGFLLANQEAGVSTLILDPSETGRTTRRQLGFLIFPPLAAFLLLRATSADRLGAGAAMALLVVLTIGPLAALILRDAQTLTRLETERRDKRRSDEAKLAVERRYRTLFTQLDPGFCVIEMLFDGAGNPVDYRFLEANPAFATQTGLKNAEGRSMRELAPGHEQRWFDVYGRVAKTGESIRFEQEAAALGRFYDVSAFRVDEPDAHHVAILFNDISDRKRAEMDLRALNATLERRVAERAAELEAAQEALRQSHKMEAIGRLTGGVAHDFNNLLTVIKGSVDVLRRPGLLEDRRLRFTNAIGEATDRATKLTAQLLAFARRQSLQPEIFSVGASLNAVMGMLSTLTGEQIGLELNQPDDPYFVNADRSQFDIAIVNMVVNARDALGGGEGHITIATGPVSGIPALRSHSPVIGDFIAVSISDTGSGIDPDSLNRIFEPFYTTKSVGVGTGLGLSQVIGFAKQSGGDVRVESVPGQGATFTLYLPRDYADTLPSRRDPNLDVDGSGDGTRVLVVEDNVQVGEFTSQSLRELGYQTELALDAARGLAVLSDGRARFDIVFSDVVMPGMNGLEMAAEIHRLYPDLPVVLTSGYSHVLAQNGSHGFALLDKPYSIEQLSRVLRKAATGSVNAASRNGERRAQSHT